MRFASIKAIFCGVSKANVIRTPNGNWRASKVFKLKSAKHFTKFHEFPWAKKIPKIPISTKLVRIPAWNRLYFLYACAGELKQKKRKIPLHNRECYSVRLFSVHNTKACLVDAHQIEFSSSRFRVHIRHCCVCIGAHSNPNVYSVLKIVENDRSYQLSRLHQPMRTCDARFDSFLIG